MTSDLGYADIIPPTQQVRLELRSRPGCYLTAAQLCELTGLTLEQIHHAIYKLRRNVLRRVPKQMAGSNSQQAYCWDFRGMH